MNTEKYYPAKLLLFGEYAIICGGEGIAIPYDKFYAKWINNFNPNSKFKLHLINFLQYLKSPLFSNHLNIKQFEADLNNGLDIESNIPIGYGVGSSGAVVAAVFDRYSTGSITQNDLNSLKVFLGSMENFFHGQSSGLDPMVCYLNKSIHLTADTIHIINTNDLAFTNYCIEMHDTGKARYTQLLVNAFNGLMKNDQYKNLIHHEYLDITSKCIESYLQQNEHEYITSLLRLSAFQFEHFKFAIPNELFSLWEEGIKTGDIIFKLCGGGGGGFMICFQKRLIK
jgi:mevalonate kinase